MTEYDHTKNDDHELGEKLATAVSCNSDSIILC